MNLPKLGVLLYGTLAYLFFLATFLYTIGWTLGLVVPQHIDTVAGEAPSTIQALAVNGGILGIFAVQHLIMARHWFKRRITKLIPAAAERSTFVVVTCAILCSMFLFWQPMPSVIWEVSSPIARNALIALSLFGFVGVVFATFLIDHFELFGLSQVIRFFRGKNHTPPPFQVRSIYRFSRHPLYLFFFIAFWSTPTMTLGHLVFAMLCTGFVFVGVQFEERNLVAEHGERYLSYRRKVPMILPSFGRSTPPIAPLAAAIGSTDGAA
ncbi:MAG: methyltransferase [Planctomycetota bacterium]|nr:methyltransferase [Planctomycetota bacterium]